MVEGTICVHDGENMQEAMIEKCDMFLGLGIVKRSEDDEWIYAELHNMCIGGKGLNNEVVAESLARFVVGVLDQINNTQEQKKAAARLFHKAFCDGIASAMGADVLDREKPSGAIILSREDGREAVMQLLKGMEAKEGSR